jgi:RHS repeat-associated protein
MSFFSRSICVLLSLLPATALAVTVTGRTVGEWDISPHGAAVYTIPMLTPPATGDLAPSLAFVYSSHADSGYLGVGWNVSGLSAISRCASTWASNGTPRNIRLDLQDRFCLDGIQLKHFSGTYGTAGAVYRTELETFDRITSLGTAGNGPASFTVEKKNGLIHEYGNTVDSRIEAIGTGTARAWALNKVRDRSGNAIVFTYDEDGTNGGFRIKYIDYVSNQLQGLTAAYRIEFVYQALPANEVDTSYLASSIIKRMERLDRVDLTFGGLLVRRYELTYETSLSSTSRSRLQSIQECAGSTPDCFLPTSFTYQNGTNGLTTRLDTLINTNHLATLHLDINGDGRSDLAFSSGPAPFGSGVWRYSLANTNGTFATPVSTTVANTNLQQAIPIDYNADGKEDVLVPLSGNTWWVILGTGTGLSNSPINTGVPLEAGAPDARAFDINGDGYDDLVWRDRTEGNNGIKYALRVPAGTFSAAGFLLGPLGQSAIIPTGPVFPVSQGRVRDRQPDFDGDGRKDFLVRVTQSGPTLNWVFIRGSGLNTTITVGSSGGFSSELRYPDLNGDGMSDMVYAHGGFWRYRFSLGAGMSTEQTGPAVTTTSIAVSVAVDWDHDGYEDLIYQDTSSNELRVLRSTGEGLLDAASTGFTAPATSRLLAGDVNGDGLDDVSLVSTSGTLFSVYRHAGVMPDLLGTVTDAFGNTVTYTYGSLANNVLLYFRGNSTYPQQTYSGPLYVVSNLNVSAGNGSTFNLYEFVYHEARVDLQGRGFLGFESREWWDGRDTTSQSINYRQDFPFIGQPTGGSIGRLQDAPLFSYTLTYGVHTYGTGIETRYLPYVDTSDLTRRELTGSFSGSAVRRTFTDNVVDATTGTLYDTTTTETELATGNGLQPGATYVRRVLQPAAELTNDTSNWCLGRPGRVEETRSHSAYEGDAITRTVQNTWDTIKCRLSVSVDEPGNAQLEVTRDYTYDDEAGETDLDFGNLTKLTVTGFGMTPRITRTSYGPTGRFPDSVTDALGQTTTFNWNHLHGLKSGENDPNNVDVSWSHDEFGRLVQVTREDDTSTTYTYHDCVSVVGGCSNANNKAVVIATERAAGGAPIRETWTYLDPFDRPISTRATMLNGAFNRVDREYDMRSRLKRESAPCWAASCTLYWTEYFYDQHNRLETIRRPTSDSDPTLQFTNIAYEGMTTRVIDAMSKETVYVANAAGQTIRVTDDDGYYQHFDYDAFGNRLRVVDSAANPVQTNTFNLRGMLLTSHDPDRGTQTAVSNPLGELISLTNALGKQQTFTYDLIGRLTTRVMPECTSGTITHTFSFGTNAIAFNVGKLAYREISGCGQNTFRETFSYDSFGRLTQTDSLEGASTHYFVNRTYNAEGRLATVTYPTTTQSYRLKVQYDYQNGFLLRAKDFNAPATVFWEANATDAQGMVIDEELGANLSSFRGYDPVNGLLDFIQTGPGGSATLQNLDYKWNRVGNVTERRDVNQNITEKFFYDDLHRLDSSTRNDVTNMDLVYDQLGNITSKTGVGTYTYHATRIHAVSSINTGSGTLSFTYNANGEMTNRAGTTLFYYANGLLKQATKDASNSMQISYTADGRRWANHYFKDGAGYAIRYISDEDGMLYEKINSGGGVTTEHKHYIRAGGRDIALYVRKVVLGTPNVFTNTLYYLLSDHLGSTDVVTDATGAVVVRESFDAFGKRRGTNWTGSPTAAEINTMHDTTRRGFTFHEHMDSVDLVHMNGRAFDPNIGRFVSPDPLIDCELDTQGWNRYSYVKNSPLRFTDPSGFATDEVLPTVPVWGTRPPSFGSPRFPQPVGQGGHGPGGNKWPRPIGGSGIGGIPGAPEEPMAEITLSGTRPDDAPLSVPPVMLVNLDFSASIIRGLSPRDRRAIDEGGRQFEDCMDNCTRFGTEGITDPLASVAGGAADGRLPGALAGAISAGLDTPAMNDILSGAFTGAAAGRMGGEIEPKSTPASRNRSASAGARGGAVGGAISSVLSLAGSGAGPAELLFGAMFGNAVESYFVTKWNKEGKLAARFAALDGAGKGLRGALVNLALREGGERVTNAVCDVSCSTNPPAP